MLMGPLFWFYWLITTIFPSGIVSALFSVSERGNDTCTVTCAEVVPLGSLYYMQMHILDACACQ